MEAISDKQALENFITCPDLASLESSFGRFNIFEVMNVTRRELNHSSFLAFLLDPYGSHGLADLFLRRFLQSVITSGQSTTDMSVIDIDFMDLTRADVTREHQNIDVLIRDAPNRLVVIIENKVDSKQHSDQLVKYYEYVTKTYPGYRLLSVYLTLDGDDPENDKYVAFSHSKVRGLIQEVLSKDGLLFDPTVRSAIEQYGDLLGRHFMADEKLQELCVKIYKRHKQAIDLIRENIPDDRETIAEELQTLVSEAGFILDDSNYSYVRFLPKQIDLPFFKGSTDWTDSRRLILFEFQLRQSSLLLRLQMGPGDQSKRTAIHQFAVKNKRPFSADKTLYTKWQQLYKKQILTSSDYDEDREAISRTIKERWADFLRSDLPQIVKLIEDQPWQA